MEASMKNSWIKLSAEERDALCAKYMPASVVNPLRQWWLTLEGKYWCRLMVENEEEASRWLAKANESKQNWDKLIEDWPWVLREEVGIKEQTWHVRYSTTPGGAWDLLEDLKKKGWTVQIILTPERISLSIIKDVQHIRLGNTLSEPAAFLYLLAHEEEIQD
jgi:hypothetical protein